MLFEKTDSGFILDIYGYKENQDDFNEVEQVNLRKLEEFMKAVN